MKKSLLVYGRRHTTAYVLIHALRRLLTQHAHRTAGWHCHLVLDDRRDEPLARELLPEDRVSVEGQYESMDPYDSSRTWPEARVRTWERRYGDPNLRSFISNERALSGRREDVKWRYLFAHLEYFEKLSERLRPDLYVSGAADGLLPWVALSVLRANAVPCLSFSPCRFGTRSFVLDSPYEVLRVSSSYKRIATTGLDRETQSSVDRLKAQYSRGEAKPLDHVAVQSIRRRWIPNPLTAIALLREAWSTDAGYFDQPLRQTFSRAMLARRSIFYRSLLPSATFATLPDDENFIFFPLQLEPESSLSTQGRGWTDQLALVRLVSHSLPIDRWLYVKEHPSMPAGVRPWAFYRSIMALPRVRLVSQGIKSVELIPRAEAVATVTGTAGWEALMLGTPVVLFGHAFYEEFEEGVTVINEIEDLPRVLYSQRQRTIPSFALDAYIAAVLERAPEGIISEPRYLPSVADTVMSTENLDRIAGVILWKMEQGDVAQTTSRMTAAV